REWKAVSASMWKSCSHQSPVASRQPQSMSGLMTGDWKLETSRSLLREWLVERGNDRRALFLLRLGLVFFDVRGGGARRGRRHVFERQAGDNALDLFGVEHLAREQFVGHLDEDGLVLREERECPVVRGGHEALHFLIDPERRVFAVVLVLRDLAAEEDLLFLLAER